MNQLLFITIIAGAATAVGSLLSYLLPKKNKDWLAAVLGFAAGIMIGISLFDLLPEAFNWGLSLTRCLLGFVCGIFLMVLLSFIMKRGSLDYGNYRNMGFFIAAGIALHNLPEGIAVGASFQSNIYLGIFLAAVLLIHNIPEGIAIAVPLLKGGLSRLQVFLITLAAGMITPLGAILGFVVSDLSYGAMSLSLSLAAGAMVFISFHELVYESYSLGKHYGEAGVFVGIILAFLCT